MDGKYYEIIIPELYNEIRHRRDYLMKIMSIFGFFYMGVTGWVIAYQPSVGSLKSLLLTSIIYLTLWGSHSIFTHIKEYNQTAKIIVALSNKLELFDEEIYPSHWKQWGESSLGYVYYLGTLLIASSMAFISILSTK